jgi:hypothetical protein
MIATTIHTTTVGDVTLEERHTIVGLSFGPVGAAMSYRRPAVVTHRGEATTIPDVVLYMKLAALVITLLVIITKRRAT